MAVLAGGVSVGTIAACVSTSQRDEESSGTASQVATAIADASGGGAGSLDDGVEEADEVELGETRDSEIDETPAAPRELVVEGVIRAMVADSGATDAGPASPSIGSFAVYATEAIELNSGSLITGCSAGVEGSAGPFLSGGAAAYFNSGAKIQPTQTLYAFSVYLNSGASLGPVDTDHVMGNSSATYGTVSTFPAMPAAPTLPPATAGTTAVTLNSGATRTLSAGAYGAVTVNSGATLALSGGTYVFSSLTLNSGATMAVSAATTLSVTGAASFNSGSFAGPAAGSGLTAKALVLYFDTSSGISLNSGARVQALFIATKALVTVNTSSFTGALAAAQVLMNSGATVTCQDGFGSLGGSCSGSCDDGNPCTTDACSSGECTHTPVTSGTACNDGDACDLSDTCQGGACTAGSHVTCTAPDSCHTAGTCNSATGVCSAATLTAGFCDIGGACVASGASNGTNTCETCQPSVSTTAYSNVSNGTACSDGDACDLSDTCQAGACTAGSHVTCSASDQCHTAGTCSPSTGQCTNPAAANGVSCNDGNTCTQTDACESGVCTGSNPVTCSASDQCHAVGTCNPATGACSNPAAANGAACNDGSACDLNDTCQAGVCVAGTSVVCAASDQCHVAGLCNPSTGACTNPTIPDGTSCSDGNACTQTDSCMAGTCGGSNPIVCTASDECHAAGVCNPTSGQCSNPSAADGTACGDGNLCVFPGSEICAGGACVGTSKCGGAECTSSQCDPISATCAPAVQGTPCTGGACDGSGNCTQGGAAATSVTTSAPVCPPSSSPCSTGPGVYDSLVHGCYYIPAPAGTPCPEGACDGDNNCVPSRASSDAGASYVAVEAAACLAAGACTNAGSIDFQVGACVYVNLVAGATCPGGACDGNGNCGAAATDGGTADSSTGSAADGGGDAGPRPCDDGNPCTADKRTPCIAPVLDGERGMTQARLRERFPVSA